LSFIERLLRAMTQLNIGAPIAMVLWILCSGRAVAAAAPGLRHRSRHRTPGCPGTCARRTPTKSEAAAPRPTKEATPRAHRAQNPSLNCRAWRRRAGMARTAAWPLDQIHVTCQGTHHAINSTPGMHISSHPDSASTRRHAVALAIAAMATPCRNSSLATSCSREARCHTSYDFDVGARRGFPPRQFNGNQEGRDPHGQIPT
jgi:hypothetical protein